MNYKCCARDNKDAPTKARDTLVNYAVYTVWGWNGESRKWFKYRWLGSYCYQVELSALAWNVAAVSTSCVSLVVEMGEDTGFGS